MLLCVGGGLMLAGGALLVGGIFQHLYTPKFLARVDFGLAGRAIGQGWLAHDYDTPGKSSETFADVYEFAAMLARAAGPGPFYEGEERDPSVLRHWFYTYDPAWRFSKQHPTAILTRTSPDGPATLAPNFRGSPVAWAVAIFPPDIRISQLPPETPLIWTRGLRSDGTWREDGPLGGEGGAMGFVAGYTMQYKGPVGSGPSPLQLVKWGTKTPTTNILEALPPGTRISEHTPPPEVAAYARWLPMRRRLFMALSAALLVAASLAIAHAYVRSCKLAMILAALVGTAGALWFWCEWFG